MKSYRNKHFSVPIGTGCCQFLCEGLLIDAVTAGQVEMTQNQVYGLRGENSMNDDQDLTPMYEVIDDIPNINGDLSYEYVL